MTCPVAAKPDILELRAQPDGMPLPVLVSGHMTQVSAEAGGAPLTVLARRGPTLKVLSHPETWGMGGVTRKGKLRRCPVTGAEMQSPDGGLLNMNELDGNVHRRHPQARNQVKHLVGRAAAAAELSADKAIIRTAVRRLSAFSTADIAAELIIPAGIELICWSLGLPLSDWAAIERASLVAFRPVHGTDLDPVEDGWKEIYAFYDYLLEHRMPKRGIIVGVVRATKDRPPGWTSHLLANISNGYPAFIQSTLRLFWEALTRYPQDVADCLAGRMTWEALARKILNRWALYPIDLPRVLLAPEAVVDGVRFEQGALVLPSLVGVAWDADYKAPPDNIAFGHGPHLCFGLRLVMQWLVLLLEAFWGTFPGAKVTGDAPVWVGDSLAAPKQIMVKLRPA